MSLTDLAIGDPLERDQERHEENGQYDEAFGGASLNDAVSHCTPALSPILWQPYNHTVVPGEDDELIQASDEVPARGDVSSKEDAKREDGDRVHEAARSCFEDGCTAGGEVEVERGEGEGGLLSRGGARGR